MSLADAQPRGRCSWCGQPDVAAFHGCSRPAPERRRAGWPALPVSGHGPSRAYVLTQQGWQQAGYRNVNGQWVRRTAP